MVGSTFTVYKANMEKKVTFGEIMLRLSPPNRFRFGQTRSFKGFGIQHPETNVTHGKLLTDIYKNACQASVKKYEKLKTNSITLRCSGSASHTTLSAILYRSGKVFVGRIYKITDIFDRVGSGDSLWEGWSSDFQTILQILKMP
jgi:hypothetical protein